MNSELIVRYIDYFLPREVLGPVIIVFSAENVIDIVFTQYMPVSSELAGWSVVLLLSIIIVAIWGETDDDMDEFEEELEEEGLK